MARDRKRAKQRQRRRGGQQQPARPTRVPGTNPPPDPLGQAAPDAELAELAEEGLQEPGAPVGRPLEEQDYPHRDELEGADVIEEVEAEERGDEAEVTRQRRRRSRREAAGRELPREGNRFINFLRACVAELRRVQWPDRRQVGQATAVVLVFVIIAGSYLGLLDALFSRVVDAIL